jgi:hypothetical protein
MYIITDYKDGRAEPYTLLTCCYQSKTMLSWFLQFFEVDDSSELVL